MRPVLRVDKRNREVLARYETIAEAERQLGINCLSRTCSKRLVGPHTWYLRFEDDFDPEEDFTGRMNCPVIAMDVETGKAKWYPSAAKCADSLGFARPTVVRAIQRGHAINGQFKVARYGKRLV